MLGVDEVVERLTDAVAECGALPALSCSDPEVVRLLDAVHAAEQGLRAAKLRWVRQVDIRKISEADHASSVNNWLRWRLRISPSEAKRLLVHAAIVDAVPVLKAALGAGSINAEQLAVIVETLGDLPAKLDPAIRAAATDTLVQWAAQLDPVQLRRAGRRIMAHVAPEVADAAEEAALRREERQAYRTRYFTMVAEGDGSVRLRGSLDAEAAAIVSAAIDPLCAPGAAGDERTPEQRRADALTEVCRRVLTGGGDRSGRLPDNGGGERPQLVVTVPYDVVKRQLGPGVLETGEPVSAEAVRRLACDAKILPVVLDGAGQVLDLGRSRRLVSGPLRRALVVRDGGCAFPACDRPPRWCDAHHVICWDDLGCTDLDNTVLLCGFHHRLLHDGEWTVRMAADGLPEFLPPVSVDPEQRPRRNLYFRRDRYPLRT